MLPDLATSLPDTSDADVHATGYEAEAWRDHLTKMAFDDALGRPFLLLDAAADPAIHVHLDAFPEPARCLFDGAVADDLAEVGPWLAEPTRHGDLWDWYLEEGWGRDWGVILVSALPAPRLKQHLKKFLNVERENGERNFFKFYRPQHLVAYLPVFDSVQTAQFMRGIDAWIVEADGGRTVERFMLEDDGILQQTKDRIGGTR